LVRFLGAIVLVVLIIIIDEVVLGVSDFENAVVDVVRRAWTSS
jgi:hypothetical protein